MHLKKEVNSTLKGIPDLHLLIEDTQRFLLGRSWSSEGKSFYHALAEYLVDKLEMEDVCIHKLLDGFDRVETVIKYHDRQIIDEKFFSLQGTPCEIAVGKGFLCIPERVCEIFPDNELLRKMGAQSYIGITLYASSGIPLGIIAITGRRSIKKPEVAELILKQVSIRAAAELEYRHSETRLQQSEKRYQDLFNTMQEGFCVIEVIFNRNQTPVDARVVITNAAFEKQSGLKIDQVAGKLFSEIIPEKKQPWLETYGTVAKTGKPVRFERKVKLLGKWFVVLAYRLGNAEEKKVAIVFKDITDRKNIEEKLRYHANLVERISEAIISTDDLFRIESWNAAAEMIYGWKQEEVLGKSSAKVLKTQYLDHTTTEDVIKQMQEQGSWKGEVIQLTKDGKPIYIYASIKSIRDENGKLTGVVTINSDITDKKEAEQLIRQSRLDLERTAEVAHIGWWRLDSQNNYLSWSEQCYRIFGLPTGTVLNNQSFIRLVHPDDLEYVNSEWKNSLSSRAYDVEHRIIVDGEMKWIREKAYLEFNDEGDFLGCFGITQDITGQKHIEHALRESEKALNAILDASSESIGLFDIDGKALMLNKKALQRIGKPRQQVIGKSGYDFLPHNIADSRFKRLRQVADSGRPVTFEDTRNGFFFEHTFYPVFDLEGKVTRVAIYSRDITERKLNEVKLNQSNEALELMVSNRTRELENEIAERKTKQRELVKSKKNLRELTMRMEAIAEEERTRISREIHDEIGHLLTALKYDIESLVNAEVDSMEHVNTELNSMISMVDAVMDTVRKISSELRPGILDHLGLIPAIEWQVKQFRKRTKICCVYDPPSIEFEFNKQETTIIYRIFQEILTNIIRHANANHVEVSLSERRGRFQLKVTDNGIGFDTKEKMNGGSLGLLGMRERALSIGGDLKIKSKKDRGTSIVFNLKKN